MFADIEICVFLAKSCMFTLGRNLSPEQILGNSRRVMFRFKLAIIYFDSKYSENCLFMLMIYKLGKSHESEKYVLY